MHGAFGPCGPVVEGPPRRGSSTKAQRPPRRRRSSARPDAIGVGPCAGGETLGRLMPKQWNYWYGMYTWYIHITAWQMIYHIISYHIHQSINLSIYLSIHPSIHLSAHIHIVNIIAGRFFVWWLVVNVCILLFLFGDIYGPFLIILGGYSTIGILLYTTQWYGIMRLIKFLHNHW